MALSPSRHQSINQSILGETVEYGGGLIFQKQWPRLNLSIFLIKKIRLQMILQTDLLCTKIRWERYSQTSLMAQSKANIKEPRRSCEPSRHCSVLSSLNMLLQSIRSMAALRLPALFFIAQIRKSWEIGSFPRFPQPQRVEPRLSTPEPTHEPQGPAAPLESRIIDACVSFQLPNNKCDSLTYEETGLCFWSMGESQIMCLWAAEGPQTVSAVLQRICTDTPV